MDLASLLSNDAERHRLFPNLSRGTYLAHSGVAPLAGPAAEAFRHYAEEGSVDSQERRELWLDCLHTRVVAAEMIGARRDEIALLGPTALGLSLIAEGLSWAAGDEVVCHGDDYPANVYPWTGLERFGVVVRKIQPSQPGVITWDLIAEQLTERTKLVALASAHYLSGYRPDLERIGAELRQRGVLLCVDGIQTMGAFPLRAEWMDFCSADAHKWLMGPSGQGVVYVAKHHQDAVRPLLRGSWNVHSPEFVATADSTDERLVAGAQRYEPGTLNVAGILAMRAGMELLLELGVDAIGQQILANRAVLLAAARAAGWHPIHGDLEDQPGADRWRTGILALRHDQLDPEAISAHLKTHGHTATVRRDRAGQAWLRLAPHGYQTEAEMAAAGSLLGG